MEKQSFFSRYRTVFVVLIGEIIASFIMCLVYFLIGKFDYTVVTGAALGSLVAVVNITVLSISINTAVDKFLAERGTAPMTDEEAEAYANERATKMAFAAGGTFVVRILLIAAALILAFLFRGEWFDLVATIIPISIYQPIIHIDGMIQSKKGQIPFMADMPKSNNEAEAPIEAATGEASEGEADSEADGACAATEADENCDGAEAASCDVLDRDSSAADGTTEACTDEADVEEV